MTVRVAPNRNTVGLIALLIAMWYAGASQNNSAAYLLGFVLTGVAIVSVLHTGANLRGLRLNCGRIAPAFAGEPQRVPITATAEDGKTHVALRIKLRDGAAACALSEVRAGVPSRAEFSIEATERGHFDELPLRVSSLYPLGFFTAHAVVTLHESRWIYPKPEGPLPFPLMPAAARYRGGGGSVREGDDFAGLRAYVPGEPHRHIDWKAVARGQGLVVKQWAGDADESLHFRWEDTAGLGHEARLSQLARWIVQAERQLRAYALTLPGTSIATAHGDAHFHECLRALAAFPKETE
jgi:uncharacterized protein (DUF58 family)